jgi:hypothetical protein
MSKLPQPLVNLIDVAATPAILRSSICTTLRETRILVLAVLGHLAYACLHHTMLYKILSNRAQCSTTRYVLIQTWYILVLTRYIQVHTGMYWLHTRQGHIAQGMYTMYIHVQTLYALVHTIHTWWRKVPCELSYTSYPWSQMQYVQIETKYILV